MKTGVIARLTKCLNSLVHGRFERKVRWINFELFLVIDGWYESCENALGWMSLILQMILQHWFRWWLGAISQQTINWTSVDPDLCRHMASPWASCQIHKIAGAHAPGMPGTFSPPRWVSDLDMHHGTCVTHVPWCMSGSLSSGFLWSRPRGKTFPAFPAHAQPAILRIW